jgi:two-component system, OmpR family, sensor histidine kinase SaeS
VKLRSYLLIANGVSITIILVCLLISYDKMLLSFNQTMWLSTVALLAGLLSFVVHFFMTRPIEKSIITITEQSKRLAVGDFQISVPLTGPIEYQELGKQFNEMANRLEESFEKVVNTEQSRRELIANVSHDLRTPLASIQSFVEALQDDVLEDKETYERYLATIKTETQRLSKLINDLFDLSRLEAGAEVFEPDIYHVDSFILESLQGIALQLKERQIDVVVDVPESVPAVWMVAHQMKRVLDNLLQNAITYSPSGSNIYISAEKTADEFVRIALNDEGEGMEEGELLNIFDRFYRADKSRNREKGGAGLGLAIAKSIIELHGGTIGAQSEPGKGSCFWFTIPIYKGNDESE